MPVAEGRKTVDSVQDGDIPAPAADVTDLTIPGGPSSEVSIKVYRPAGSTGALPVLLYTHGAGWVFGDAHTHDRLVRELTTRAGAATVFTNYDLSPEARYPTAIEQIYPTPVDRPARRRTRPRPGADRRGRGLRRRDMTAAITIMAKQRGGPRIAAQLLYYPVTNANFGTGSYQQFAEHYWLRRDAMQ